MSTKACKCKLILLRLSITTEGFYATASACCCAMNLPDAFDDIPDRSRRSSQVTCIRVLTVSTGCVKRAATAPLAMPAPTCVSAGERSSNDVDAKSTESTGYSPR